MEWPETAFLPGSLGKCCKNIDDLEKHEHFYVAYLLAITLASFFWCSTEI